MKSTRLSFTEPQLRVVLASLRQRIEMYEGDLAELQDDTNDEEREWYEARIAELRPLERRVNRAGLRLSQ